MKTLTVFSIHRHSSGTPGVEEFLISGTFEQLSDFHSVCCAITDVLRKRDTVDIHTVEYYTATSPMGELLRKRSNPACATEVEMPTPPKKVKYEVALEITSRVSLTVESESSDEGVILKLAEQKHSDGMGDEFDRKTRLLYVPRRCRAARK